MAQLNSKTSCWNLRPPIATPQGQPALDPVAQSWVWKMLLVKSAEKLWPLVIFLCHVRVDMGILGFEFFLVPRVWWRYFIFCDFFFAPSMVAVFLYFIDFFLGYCQAPVTSAWQKWVLYFVIFLVHVGLINPDAFIFCNVRVLLWPICAQCAKCWGVMRMLGLLMRDP